MWAKLTFGSVTLPLTVLDSSQLTEAAFKLHVPLFSEVLYGVGNRGNSPGHPLIISTRTAAAIAVSLVPVAIQDIEPGCYASGSFDDFHSINITHLILPTSLLRKG